MTRHAHPADGRSDRRRQARSVLLGLALVVVTAGLGSPAVAAPPAGDAPSATHRHGALVRNRPPALPTDVGIVQPDAACVSRHARTPVRSATPTLTATLTDPDGASVRGVFTVDDARTGRPVWGPVTTAPQGSGSAHSVTVPADVLVEGRPYRWRVAALDDRGRRSRTVRCGFLVDVTAPGVPSVTAVAGTGRAVYVEDAIAGGVGEPGDFRVEGDGSADVLGFSYTFDGAPAQVRLEPGAPAATITVVPTYPGGHLLTVRAVDTAGNIGPERSYAFTVPSASRDAAWQLDEGTGTSAADSGPAGDVHPLTLHGSAGWGAGPLRDLGFDPADGGLLLAGDGATATTAGPVVDTAASFSVLAFARPDAVGSAATVVSQDGTTRAHLSIGQRVGAGCPDGLTTCWTFELADGAGPGAPVAVATSSVPVRAGSWALLVAVHDAAAGTARLDVCEIGSAEAPAAGVPVTGVPVPTTGAWPSTGAFRLGGALREGALLEPWQGAVGSVGVRSGMVDDGSVRRTCMRGMA